MLFFEVADVVSIIPMCIFSKEAIIAIVHVAESKLKKEAANHGNNSFLHIRQNAAQLGKTSKTRQKLDTYTFNNLTNFEYAAYAMAGNGSYVNM